MAVAILSRECCILPRLDRIIRPHCLTSSRSQSLQHKPAEKHHGDDCWAKELTLKDINLVADLNSEFNHIRVLEVAAQANHHLAGARLLLLDRSGNIHSLYNPGSILTHSYFDNFSTLPALIRPGPFGIFGLGAGTAARSLLHFWPRLEIHGWELDEAVIDIARMYFDLSDLETTAQTARPPNTGRLHVHVGDALAPEAIVPGRRFSGLVVDIFADGGVIPALQEPSVWRNFKERMLDNGRIMVNCGGLCVDRPERSWMQVERTLEAMKKIFPGELWKMDLQKRGGNILALTGAEPDLARWGEALPPMLKDCIVECVPVL